MNKLNNTNKKFNDDYKILEENFRITLSKINEKNSNSYIKEKKYKANEKSENIIKRKKTSINKINELKKEFEDLNNEYKELLELDFDKNIFINKENTSKNKLFNTKNILKELKEKNNKLKIEINISKEKLNKSKEENNNLKTKYESYKNKINNLNQENENFSTKSAEQNKK